MESAFRYLAPAGACGYLPDQMWRLEYEFVYRLSPSEYMERMHQGWRRFGLSLFRPRCRACCACQPLRVVVDRFRAARNQRRVRKLNRGSIRLQVTTPSVTGPKLELYDRYHANQAASKGWPDHAVRDAHSYVNSFVHNPFPTQEWCYFLGDRLVGVSYVDVLPGGLSAIYCFYDPEERERSLGTWNVLSILEEAARRRIPHVYLGYYVAGCASMAYKKSFRPNQILGPDGAWHDFVS